MRNTKKKNYYNSIPINDHSPEEVKAKTSKRLEDEAISRALYARRREIEEHNDELDLEQELKEWDYV